MKIQSWSQYFETFQHSVHIESATSKTLDSYLVKKVRILSSESKVPSANLLFRCKISSKAIKTYAYKVNVKFF